MIDVLLASANSMALDRKRLRKQRPFPPLSTLWFIGGGDWRQRFDTTRPLTASGDHDIVELQRGAR